MIPNQWYIVLDSGQVKNQPIGVTRMGEKLVFWRDRQGKPSCLRDKCCHRGAQLSLGKIVNQRLQCPFHGFEYDATGRVVLIPANGKNTPVPEHFRVQQYPTHEAHGFIWLWWGENPSPDLQPPRFFDDLDESFSYAQIRDPWPIHYSRAIENQLDVMHLPFVHTNTIGRGNRTLVDGPVVKWIGDDKFRFFVFNRVDDGSPPRKPEEIPNPESGFHLDFIFPNLWQNTISDNVRVVAAFVPVDAENSLIYLRFYQNFLRLPLLRDAINWLAMPFNRKVLHQDRRVVLTQQPRITALQMGEALAQGDRPIVEYRRRRQQLIADGR